MRGAERILTTYRPLVLFEWWPRALVAREINIEAFLSWIEHDLGMLLSVVPEEASGLPHVADALRQRHTGDVRVLTRLLLDQSDPVAHVELLAKPRERH
jgi:hypothetical protein